MTRPAQAAAFVATSLATDFAAVATATMLMLWLCRSAGVGHVLALALAALASMGPILLADFLQYRLLAYLGDAFDVALMFDLTGRSPGEFLAVASQHLIPVLTTIVVGLSVLAAVVWMVRRARRPVAVDAPPLGRGVVVCLLLLAGAGALNTAARSGSDVLDNGLRRKPTGQLIGAMVIAATDVDRDGFGILGRPPDPDLFDDRISPYALERPGSGVDENGVGGDLPAGAAPYVETLPPLTSWRSKPDVVLVVLESFRADAVGAAVRGQPVTPVLSDLAARGIRLEHAYSHNGYTVQSRHHILSGSLAGFDIGSLVQDFNANGYQTAYFSAQDESFGGSKGTIGFSTADVAYDARADRSRRYTAFTTPGSLAVPHAVLAERIDEFLAARDTDRPLFLYVNFHDTHFPYHHGGMRALISDIVVPQGDIQPRTAGAVREMYLNTAANVDRAIGDLLQRVRNSLGRDPGVIVLADHGESLFDESFLGHGYALNDAQTRIPLIVANLPLTLEEPFGQSELRGVLRTGLATAAPAASAPRLTRSPTKAVFQYLGNIDRPAEIALVTSTGRTAYHLRDRRFRSDAGPARPPERLSDRERQQFLTLVHMWERMILARSTGPRADE